MTQDSKNIAWIVIIIVLLFVGYLAFVKKPVSTPTNSTTNNSVTPTYKNDQYGFSIDLPSSWKGYKVLVTGWEGRDMASGKVSDHGPIITLRHPDWTTANPREDMPIMVFTPAQWDLVIGEKMSVGAAPIPPSSLDKNSQYVLALPARYNYDYKTGWEEVDTLVHTLKAFEPSASAEVDATGQHCGGFIANAPTCPTGYTCKLNKIADTGGSCVKDDTSIPLGK